MLAATEQRIFWSSEFPGSAFFAVLFIGGKELNNSVPFFSDTAFNYNINWLAWSDPNSQFLSQLRPPGRPLWSKILRRHEISGVIYF